MKITKVDSIVLLDQYHIVTVETDEGIRGVGEVSPMKAAVSDAVVQSYLAPLLIGEDPANIEKLWQKMYYTQNKLGPMGVLLNAIAGIDIALWDIAGKVAGQPIYNLLGGVVHPEPEVYASSMARGMTPQVEAERALSFKEQGYRAYKIHSATPWMYDMGEDYTLDTVRTMRELVGPDFDILVDVNNAYLLHTAITKARQLEEYRVWHFEEPLATHDHASYAKLAAAVDIPIAAGEQEYTRWQMRDLILDSQLDILQPDVIKAGGITEFRKIEALAETFNKPITVHNTQPTIGTAAHLHVWASSPMCLYPQEYNIEPHPLRDEYPIWQEPLVIKDGRMQLTTTPGLGVELDDEMVARIRTN